ncbi:ASCH domain-containing protein [Methylosinus sp. Sm6]|uniref:ASCH domain-containing protein n=1 Tax=Methylosinus sp. Sm6 TaxID=2866948 RepID=UPI001C995D7B|nr:ASCH domain-containing protein [Methylosinus sp. Sm6]MBY6243877.1 ASCH domain-containing protein [Methylosinus sp. Sm6]
MVAYSFQKRFAEPIVERRKRQTIRGNRKRHARLGEPMQLYVGMRTKHCRKIIHDPVCTGLEPFQMDLRSLRFFEGREELVKTNTDWLALLQNVPVFLDGRHLPRMLWNELAEADGFSPYYCEATGQSFSPMVEMTKFWLASHGANLFDGVLIRWDFP